MHSNETNKIACAVLGVMTFTLGLSLLSGAIFAPRRPARPAYSVEVQEASAPAQAAAPEAVDIAQVMANADAARGQNSFRQCATCHTVEKGGPNRVGPNLFGVVTGPVAHLEGFNYSNAFKALRAANRTWTYEELYRFLENPRGHVPGTNMTFAGVRRSGERGDLIAYLRQNADSPAPLP